MTTATGLPHASAAAARDRAAGTTRGILAELFERHGLRDFAIRLWDGQTLAAEGGLMPHFTLVLTHPGALRRMFFPPGELTLGEAYLRGDFDLEGDIIAAMELAATFEALTPGDWLRLAAQALALPAADPPEVFRAGREPARLRGALHSRARDRAAVTYHYDTGNEFYALFLGQWMAYSCAYFPTRKADLDSAQTAKFEHICRKLRLRPGERLLDIGCGWGGLVAYAAETYGVQTVGITLSEPQAEFAREWLRRAGLSDRARIEVRDYRDLDPTDSFDKVVSVGMFEHVGRANLPEYFGAASRALRPGGLFLNHGIAAQNARPASWLERTFLQRGQFAQRYVFPDGELAPISEALWIAEQTGFEVRDMESLREHYALTLRQWVRNLEAHHAEAMQLKDERTYRTWRLYMAAAAHGFERGQTNVFQALLSKSRNGVAEVPLTRADLYHQ
ncbi:MAG: class I SAM-dependent methyltransferase [Chloroflexi bacterium]|nr:class I SAM-dependent methyltransferase [Chloroflexota bacterium]